MSAWSEAKKSDQTDLASLARYACALNIFISSNLACTLTHPPLLTSANYESHGCFRNSRLAAVCSLHSDNGLTFAGAHHKYPPHSLVFDQHSSIHSHPHRVFKIIHTCFITNFNAYYTQLYYCHHLSSTLSGPPKPFSTATSNNQTSLLIQNACLLQWPNPTSISSLPRPTAKSTSS